MLWTSRRASTTSLSNVSTSGSFGSSAVANEWQPSENRERGEGAGGHVHVSGWGGGPGYRHHDAVRSGLQPRVGSV